MNNTILIGRLTKDPDLRATASGTAVCTFSLAVDRRFKNNNGEKQTDFIGIVCWRGIAESVGKYITKGSKVCVKGWIQTRSYDANDGTKRYVTEVVADEVEFLESKSSRSESQGQQPSYQPPLGSPFDNDYGEDITGQDELPF